MKSRMVLPLFSLLLAATVFICSEQAQAVEVNVGVGVHHGRHFRGGVEILTTDPGYSTWYPDDTSYAYEPVIVEEPVVVYRTESPEYDVWFGSGRSGHEGHYSRGHDSYRGYRSGGGGGGHRR